MEKMLYHQAPWPWNFLFVGSTCPVGWAHHQDIQWKNRNYPTTKIRYYQKASLTSNASPREYHRHHQRQNLPLRPGHVKPRAPEYYRLSNQSLELKINRIKNSGVNRKHKTHLKKQSTKNGAFKIEYSKPCSNSYSHLYSSPYLDNRSGSNQKQESISIRSDPRIGIPH